MIDENKIYRQDQNNFHSREVSRSPEFNYKSKMFCDIFGLDSEFYSIAPPAQTGRQKFVFFRNAKIEFKHYSKQEQQLILVKFANGCKLSKYSMSMKIQENYSNFDIDITEVRNRYLKKLEEIKPNKTQNPLTNMKSFYFKDFISYRESPALYQATFSQTENYQTFDFKYFDEIDDFMSLFPKIETNHHFKHDISVKFAIISYFVDFNYDLYSNLGVEIHMNDFLFILKNFILKNNELLFLIKDYATSHCFKHIHDVLEFDQNGFLKEESKELLIFNLKI